MKDMDNFQPSVKDSKQTDVRIEDRRTKTYGLQITHRLAIGEIPKAEDFNIHYSDISYHNNIMKHLETYVEAFKANTRQACSVKVTGSWWNRTENFILITYTFSCIRPKDIPSVSSVQPDLKRTVEIVTTALESAWIDFKNEVVEYQHERNTAYLLSQVFEASRKEAKKRLNYNARLAAMLQELESEERKLAVDNDWREQCNTELQSGGISDQLRSNVFTEMEPYFGLHIGEHKGGEFRDAGDYVKRYKELKKSMQARTEELSESEGNRLAVIQEAGYCAQTEGLFPEQCEDYVSASDTDKAVWMEGYMAAKEHAKNKEE